MANCLENVVAGMVLFDQLQCVLDSLTIYYFQLSAHEHIEQIYWHDMPGVCHKLIVLQAKPLSSRKRA